jgi:hypothetical protein
MIGEEGIVGVSQIIFEEYLYTSSIEIICFIVVNLGHSCAICETIK